LKTLHNRFLKNQLINLSAQITSL